MKIHWYQRKFNENTTGSDEVNENTLVQRKLMRIHWFRGS